MKAAFVRRSCGGLEAVVEDQAGKGRDINLRGKWRPLWRMRTTRCAGCHLRPGRDYGNNPDKHGQNAKTSFWVKAEEKQSHAAGCV